MFGIMTTWQMKDFYPEEALCAARGKIDAVTDGLVLVYGVGASLVERADITIYAFTVVQQPHLVRGHKIFATMSSDELKKAIKEILLR